MRIVVAMAGMVISAAMLMAVAPAGQAFAQVAPSASAAPSASVAPTASTAPSASPEPSGSPVPDAVVELLLSSESEAARDWAIEVTGGSPSAEFVTVEDVVGVRFTVAVLGSSATVEMTVTLPSGRVLDHGGCFEPRTGVEHDSLVAPDRVVLQIIQGGFYSCYYGTRRAGPTQAVPNGVQVDLFQEPLSRVGRTWDIAVVGGTTDLKVVKLDDFGGGFLVFFFGPSATVEMTVRLPTGWALKHGSCFFHDGSPRRDVLAGPRRLVFDVVPNGDASCDYSVTRTGGPTLPPTDVVASGAQASSSFGGWPVVFAGVAAAIVASLLIAVRTRFRW